MSERDQVMHDLCSIVAQRVCSSLCGSNRLHTFISDKKSAGFKAGIRFNVTIKENGDIAGPWTAYVFIEAKSALPVKWFLSTKDLIPSVMELHSEWNSHPRTFGGGSYRAYNLPLDSDTFRTMLVALVNLREL